jgi:hypothetical protein
MKYIQKYKGGRLQIQVPQIIIPKICGLTNFFLFYLRTFRKCGNLRAMYFLRIADPIIFANPQIHKFSPYKNKLKMLSFKFKNDFWLLEQF